MDTDITLEQVERLREKADVSYTLAKEALMRNGGNLLDALIWLEEQGQIPRPEGRFYSTRTQAPPPPGPMQPAPPQEGPRRDRKAGFLTRLRRLLLEDELDIWFRGRVISSFPMLVVIVLLLALPWVFLPALVLGLFLGCRYRFSGPDLERQDLNRAFDAVADTAQNMGHRVAEELNTRLRQSRTPEGAEKTPGDLTGEDPAPQPGEAFPPGQQSPGGTAR